MKAHSKHIAHISLSLILGTTLLALSGCQTFNALKDDISSFSFSNFETAAPIQKDQANTENLIGAGCPAIEIVKDLSTFREFPEGLKPIAVNATNIATTATLTKTATQCSRNDSSITVDLKLNINAILTAPRLRNTDDEYDADYPFFIAVTNAQNKILAKEVFYAPMHFPAGENTKKHVEILRQVIPVRSSDNASNFKIMAGFQLSEEQLAYNRHLLEQQRLEAEKQAMEKQKAAMQEKPEKEEQETIKDNAPYPLIVPKAVRMGPFDVFKDN